MPVRQPGLFDAHGALAVAVGAGDKDQVRYVAFVHGSKAEPERYRCTHEVSSTAPSRITLLRPGQAETPLPSEFNAFELIDGKFRQQKVAMTVKQAKEYCATPRNEYTIQSLLQFLKQQ